MITYIKNFFNEMMAEKGSISLTRFITFLITVVALGIAVYGTYADKSVTELVSLLLGIAVTGKVAQKIVESKS